MDEDRQTTRALFGIGNFLKLEAGTDFSPRGLIAVGVMVSAILIGSGVLVAATGWAKGRR